MKKVIIVGKPNVGKSTLFNAIAKTNEAITSKQEGTTRDIRKKVVQINNKEFMLIDSGGIEKGEEFFEKVAKKTLETAKECDIVLYVTDGEKGVDDEDKKVFKELLKSRKDIALVVNKIDNEKRVENFWNFFEFGAKNIFAISVLYNRNINSLLEWLLEKIPFSLNISEDEEESIEEFLSKEEQSFNNINVAIIGRTNVGKSSLLNALVEEERSIVDKKAGTTIDPVDETIIFQDTPITFIDTAGIRRKGKIEGIEKYALLRTRSMLERSDIAILVLDAKEGFVELDERISNFIEEFQTAAIVVFNKWDEAKENFDKMRKEFYAKFKFLKFAPVISVSAKTKKRVKKILPLILEVYKNYSYKIQTSQLNEVIKQATMRHALPSYKGKVLKIYYAVQYKIKPPTIALIMNKPQYLHFSYKRYLANSIREKFPLVGAPLILIPKSKKDGNENS